MASKALPAVENDFANLIDKDLLYVDKTDLVADLARDKNFLFLSRPRRFGKSLLASTFKELFENGKGRFKGLKLEKSKPWVDEGKYKVILLDLSNKGNDDDKDLSFQANFVSTLAEAFGDVGVTWGDNDYWVLNLERALKQLGPDELVLLIDEYDAPLTHVLKQPDEYEKRRKVLYYFFSTIKSFSKKFRFIFITGVTRISELGLFSGPNNVRDISFNSQYGAICGFTQEELEQNFKPYIANAAEVLKKKRPQEQWDEQKVLDELKLNYDGYSFEPEVSYRVYNSWSVINFFNDPYSEFHPHWLRSANSTLVHQFINRMFESSGGLFEVADFLSNESRSYTYEELSPCISHLGEENFPLTAVLFQAGYLTIKKADDDVFEIGIPNKEVKNAFINVIVAKLTENEIKKNADRQGMKYLKSIIKAFATKDLTEMKEVMNLIINMFSYEVVKKFDERTFAEVLGRFIAGLTGFAYEDIQEIQSALGRADLHLICGQYRYIFELKVAEDRDKADEAFEKGKEQFLDRKYANLLDPRIIVPGVMVIVNEQQRDENRKPSLVREIVRMEELSLTDEELTNLTGGCFSKVQDKS